MNDFPRITLSAEDYEALSEALEAPAKPTPRLQAAMQRHREMIDSGRLTVETDDEDLVAWAKASFAAQGIET